jgi:regulator of sirC expression with transglutaminase-like and TPR domain
VPSLPYEVGVQVRLGDESGAAGLIFAADGADRHYGFYPSNGSLRLVRFDGPDVFSWTILAEVRSEHYLQDDWNDLRVRVEAGTITCFLNGEVVVQSSDATWREGRAGLAQFRETNPAFRKFRLGVDLTPSAAEVETERDLREARRMEESAVRFRRLAARTHQTTIELAVQAALKEPGGGLIHAALLLARLDRPDVEVEAYRSRIARLGAELAGRIGPEAATASPESSLARLNEFFFRENGFHAARFDYGNRANSRLPEVLDDREGIPIMLCALYMEIGRGAGLDLVGLPRAGHFVVGLRVAPDKPLMVIDVYDGGVILNEPETAALTPATVPEMVLRMLNNLQSFALDEDDRPAALRYASMAVALDPSAARLRLARAALALDQGEVALARDDLARLETTPLEVREQLLLERLRAAVPPL